MKRPHSLEQTEACRGGRDGCTGRFHCLVIIKTRGREIILPLKRLSNTLRTFTKALNYPIQLSVGPNVYLYVSTQHVQNKKLQLTLGLNVNSHDIFRSGQIFIHFAAEKRKHNAGFWPLCWSSIHKRGTLCKHTDISVLCFSTVCFSIAWTVRCWQA